MEPVRHEFAVETSEIGWLNGDDLVERRDRDDLRPFSGISLAVGLGVATWTVIYLVLRFT